MYGLIGTINGRAGINCRYWIGPCCALCGRYCINTGVGPKNAKKKKSFSTFLFIYLSKLIHIDTVDNGLNRLPALRADDGTLCGFIDMKYPPVGGVDCEYIDSGDELNSGW